MIYVLVTCIGVSVMGCGWINRAEFPSNVECFAALSRMRIEPERDTQAMAVAWCQPKAAAE